MDLASAQVIGAGLAAIGVGAAAIGVGNVFGSFLESALRNPAAADGQQGRLFIGFAAAELLGLIAFAVAMIILFARLSAPSRFAGKRERRCPRSTQLPMIFCSQLFWLRVVFGIFFFGIGRGMVPKIQATVELREKTDRRGSGGARRPRGPRPRRPRPPSARGWTPRAPKQRGCPRGAGRRARARPRPRSRRPPRRSPPRSPRPKRKIRDAADAARAEIEKVAVDATQDMVAQLTGIKVGRDEAAAAVKAELHG